MEAGAYAPHGCRYPRRCVCRRARRPPCRPPDRRCAARRIARFRPRGSAIRRRLHRRYSRPSVTPRIPPSGWRRWRPTTPAGGCGSRSSTTTCPSWSIRSRRRSPRTTSRSTASSTRSFAVDARRRRRAARRSARAARRESMIYIEMERADARDRRDLVDELERSARRRPRRGHRLAARCRRAMRRRCRDACADAEGAALLRWFLDGNMTLLGHERWRADGSRASRSASRATASPVPIARRGIAPRRDRVVRERRRGAAAAQVQLHLDRPPPRAARPRRRAGPSTAGKVTGLSIHAGLWTSAALAAPPARRAGAARAARRRWRRSSASIPRAMPARR